MKVKFKDENTKYFGMEKIDILVDGYNIETPDADLQGKVITPLGEYKVCDVIDDFIQIETEFGKLWFLEDVLQITDIKDYQYWTIHNYKQYEEYKLKLDKLLESKPTSETTDVNKLINLLTVLIHEYELREGVVVSDPQNNNDVYLFISERTNADGILKKQYEYMNFKDVLKHVTSYIDCKSNIEAVEVLNKLKYSNFKLIDCRNNQINIF